MPELQGYKVFAIVKETGVDDEGLREFHQEYFNHTTYKDQARVFYTALGSGKISVGFNPLGIIKMIQDSFKRIKELGVKSYNMKGQCRCTRFVNSSVVLTSFVTKLVVLGEGLLQGGWIIFDKEGVPKAAFQENAKERIPIDKIVEEVKKL